MSHTSWCFFLRCVGSVARCKPIPLTLNLHPVQAAPVCSGSACLVDANLGDSKTYRTITLRTLAMVKSEYFQELGIVSYTVAVKAQSEFTTRKGLVMLGILLAFAIACSVFALWFPPACIRNPPWPW